MKLRLRSFETKETLKLEVPNPCTLLHLTQLLSQKLPSSSHPSPIHFSLNQKDNLTTPSPQDSIQSIGITSGDLIFFTTNPNKFSIPPSPQDSHIPNPNPDPEESMEIDDDSNSNSVSEAGNSFSVPGFLRKVFTEELGDDTGLNHKLLIMAVRAVLLESGFLEIDPITKKGNNCNNNNKFDIFASYHFTLPDIITTGNENIETVKIKFQKLGNYCKVYGSLVTGIGITHSVLINEDKLVPFLNVVWANCGQVVGTAGDNNRVSTVEPEREVFEFWRKTKDALALPLLIDLCEKTGLELPPCFMRLPTELKLKVLDSDSVSGVDVARVSCVCSELRYLGSSDEVWKRKYDAEFGKYEGAGMERGFKERFVKAWEGRKRRRLGGSRRLGLRSPFGSFGTRYFPPIIGGNDDIGPSFGVLGPGNRRLLQVLPDCNLNF